MSVHNGHRERMRQRFLKFGLENFCDHEILEMLLFYCVPRYNTNEIAHRLIDQFGSLSRVINAPVEALMKVKGVGPSIATYLSLLKATHRHLGIAQANQCDTIRSPEEYIAYLRNFFVGIDHEVVYVLCMDVKGTVLDCCLVSEGDVTAVNLPARKVVETALGCKATSVVLAHNHPGGFAMPSEFDHQATYMLAKTLYLTGVMLYDHVILTDHDYVSMRMTNVFDFDKLWRDE